MREQRMKQSRKATRLCHGIPDAGSALPMLLVPTLSPTRLGWAVAGEPGLARWHESNHTAAKDR